MEGDESIHARMTLLYMHDGSQGQHGQDRTVVQHFQRDRENYVDIILSGFLRLLPK